MAYQVDRDRYLKIVEGEGLAAALTAIHQELEDLEQEIFEGRKGWQPDLYEQVKALREFSVSLWDLPNGVTTLDQVKKEA